jgi:hypothetical protein
MKVIGLVELLNLCGSILYLVASILLYFSDTKLPTIIIFIVGSVLFLAASILDIYVCYYEKNKSITTNMQYIFFLGGGTFFTVGSFLFISNTTEYAGLWIFRCGSVCYIIGSIIVIYKLHLEPEKQTLLKQSVCASLLYINGSTLFLTGGILNELKLPRILFATVWVIASISFVAAGTLHVIIVYKQLNS